MAITGERSVYVTIHTHRYSDLTLLHESVDRGESSVIRVLQSCQLEGNIFRQSWPSSDDLLVWRYSVVHNTLSFGPIYGANVNTTAETIVGKVTIGCTAPSYIILKIKKLIPSIFPQLQCTVATSDTGILYDICVAMYPKR